MQYSAVMQTKLFPTSMESSANHPDPEGKPAELAESYKPSSVLPVLSKLFEKFLLSRLSMIMERPKIILNYQFSFRYKRNHRTNTQNCQQNKYGYGQDSRYVLYSMSHRHLTRYAGLHRKSEICFPSDLCAIIKSATRNLQCQIWRSGHAIKVNYGKQHAGTDTLSAIYRRSSTCFGYHNCNLCGRYTYPHKNHIEASQQLEESLSYIQKRLKKWRIRVNGQKLYKWHSSTAERLVILNALKISQDEDAKYLGLHLDRRLN